MVETRKAKLQIAGLIVAGILLAAYIGDQTMRLKRLNHIVQQNWAEVQNAYLERADLMIDLAPQLPGEDAGRILTAAAELRRALTPHLRSGDYVDVQTLERPIQTVNLELGALRGRIQSRKLIENFERIKQARRRYVEAQLDILPKVSKFPTSTIAKVIGVPKVIFLTGAHSDSERMPYFGF